MSGGLGKIHERFARTRTDESAVVLEGFHALKHAVRFGAAVSDVVTPDLDAVLRLADELAPDLADFVANQATEVPRELFRSLTDRPPASPVLSIGPVRRASRYTSGTAVVLHDPRHAGNVGACIRVAAAAGASAVIVVGDLDPWSPAVVRASAGLHYALDVARAPWPLPFDVPLVAFDADAPGAVEVFGSVPDDVAFVFGGERHGLPVPVLAAASEIRRIPMREGVSSLNLATSVAVALYLSGGEGEPS